MAHKQWQDASVFANKGKNEAYYNSQKKYEQMNFQQQLIEQKKIEIQKRLEEKKKKETEEALKKLYEDKLRSAEASRSKGGYHGHSKSKHYPGRDKPEEIVPASPATNIFSNDGSFLEQFQKISGVRVDPRKKSVDRTAHKSEAKNGGIKSEEESGQTLGKGSTPLTAPSQPQALQPPQNIQHSLMQQQQAIQQQFYHNQVMQQQHNIQLSQGIHHPPLLQQQVFTPQRMPQYPPQFNPMQCGMMIPPPMAPSSIPPPAPLNPGSIPSPSPLQPCSIPSPSPLQPYAIPPPLPLIPHSIPPPSPMVPHSIPPPSPLTPHSIPPPLPLRPQSIPPPVKRPPMFLSMVPPPPPPPPEEPKPKDESVSNDYISIPTTTASDIKTSLKDDVKDLFENGKYSSLNNDSSSIPTTTASDTKTALKDDVKDLFENDKCSSSKNNNSSIPTPTASTKTTIKHNVKDIFTNDEYSSSDDNNSIPTTTTSDVKTKNSLKDNVKDLFKDDEYSSSEEEEEEVFGPSNRSRSQSSGSEIEQKSLESNSNKESDDDSNYESDRKSDSFSDLDSELWQESRPEPEIESGSELSRPSSNAPIVIEDTETQFPSETKDSSNTEERAPPDLSSEGDSLSDNRDASGPTDSCSFRQEDIKKETEDSVEDNKMNDSVVKEENNSETVLNTEFKSEIKLEVIEEVKEEFKEMKHEIMDGVKYEIMDEVKYEESLEVMRKTMSKIPTGVNVKTEEPPVKRKRKSRWADSDDKIDIPPVINPVPLIPPVLPPLGIRPPSIPPVGVVVPTALQRINTTVPPVPASVPVINVPGMSGAMISKVTRTDPALIAYALKAFGHTNLTDVEWVKAEDHYKINLLYQEMMKKKEELQRLQAAGKHRYEYDSDEEVEGGTWEHRLRNAEMTATQLWADKLTEAAKGKHHIGDFLPPDELARFMEKYEAMKQGREPDLSDYKEFKLKEDNVGFQMLQKLGWTEGQGLGPDGSGIMDPVNKAPTRIDGQGLGLERPEDIESRDDEYDVYRKRMMLSYRFRPNPMNNPRRPYY